MSKTFQSGPSTFIVSEEDVEVDFENFYNDTIVNASPELNKTTSVEENLNDVRESSKNSGPPIVHLIFSFSTSEEEFELAGLLKEYKFSKMLQINCESLTLLTLELANKIIMETPSLKRFAIYHNDKILEQPLNMFLNSFDIIEFKDEVALCKVVFTNEKTI